jgi:hypothetical protein
VTKTIGQIAYEAFETHLKGRDGMAVSWDALPWKGDFEAAASAIVEECAKIAESIASSQSDLAKGNYSHEHHSAYMLREAAKAIRSLASEK